MADAFSVPFILSCSPDRHFNARIRGLARKNQGRREEIPR